MKRKPYEILHCQFNGSPESWVTSCTNDFENYTLISGLQADIFPAFQVLAMSHLGYELPQPTEYFLERGFDVVMDLFYGDYWKSDKEYVEEMKKPAKDRNLAWIEKFSVGLLFGLLCERWNEVAKLCAWVEVDLPPEYTGGNFEDELVHLYRSLAAGLRPEPMPGLENVESQILKCRKQEPKLLFLAWQAARAGDQPAFDHVFLKAITQFEKYFDPENSDPGDYCAPQHWIAPHHSVVALAAKRKGMKLPELSPKQQAWLISRESLGLPSQ